MVVAFAVVVGSSSDELYRARHRVPTKLRVVTEHYPASSSASATVSRTPVMSAATTPMPTPIPTSTPAATGPPLSRLPVLMFHGLTGNGSAFAPMQQWLREAGGGPSISIYLFDNDASAAPLWEQTTVLLQYIEATVRDNVTFSDGYHLLCHSQGALICRAVLELLENSNCHSFVSLAGPHMGQFGVIGNMVHYYPNISRDVAYLVLYTEKAQAMFSTANFWRDPLHLSQYLQFCNYLPLLNNESYPLNGFGGGGSSYDVTRGNPFAARWRSNFLNVNEVHLFGSPADETIVPWYSSVFDYYDEKLSRVSMCDQKVYVSDAFGLKTLDQTGRLYVNAVDGVQHTEWVTSKPIFEKYILPILLGGPKGNNDDRHRHLFLPRCAPSSGNVTA